MLCIKLRRTLDATSTFTIAWNVAADRAATIGSCFWRDGVDVIGSHESRVDVRTSRACLGLASVSH